MIEFYLRPLDAPSEIQIGQRKYSLKLTAESVPIRGDSIIVHTDDEGGSVHYFVSFIERHYRPRTGSPRLEPSSIVVHCHIVPPTE